MEKALDNTVLENTLILHFSHLFTFLISVSPLLIKAKLRMDEQNVKQFWRKVKSLIICNTRKVKNANE